MTLLLHWAWQGMLVAATVALALRMTPRLDGAARHAIWWVALAAVIGLPLAWPAGANPPAATPISLEALPDSALLLPAVPDWLGAVLAGAWLGWVALGLGRLVVGLRELGRLRAGSWPLPARVRASLEEWNSLPQDRRRAELRVSPVVRGACAIGLGRPVILLSRELVAGLDAAALDRIVLHEQAHLDRRDDWGRLAESIVACVLGLHPAIAYITRQIDLEREVACDDRVVARTRASREYARTLTDAAAIAARVHWSRLPAVVPGAMRSRRALSARVLRLLRATSPISTRARRVALAGSAVAAATAIGAARDVGPLVVFADLLIEGPAVASVSLAHWSRLSLGAAARLETGTTSRPVARSRVPVAAAEAVANTPAEPGTIGAVAPSPGPELGAAASPAEGVAPLDGRPLLMALARGSSSNGQTDTATIGPAGPWSRVQETGADLGRVTTEAGTAAGTWAGYGGKTIGRAARRSGTSVGGFFARAGRAVGDAF